MKFFFSLTIFVLFCINILSCGLIKSKNSELSQLNSQVQNGDLIFRRGRSAESQAVILTDRKSRYSHVGIIFFESEIPFVIHAVPGEKPNDNNFIKKEKLTEFLNPKKASEFAIYRSDFSKDIKNRAVLNAIQFFENKLTFDDKYDFNSDNQLYCTELVLKAFQPDLFKSLTIKSTNLNFIFGNINVIMPGNIIENPHFFKIINH